MSSQAQIPDQIRCCPSCQHITTFRYVGQQEYPATVAEAAGFRSCHFALWMCNECETSLLENTPWPVVEQVVIER